MSKAEEIKAAIEQLSLEERAELAALLAGEFPDDDWDRLMKAAVDQGKFDTMNAQADSRWLAGSTRLRAVDLQTGDV